MRTNVKLIRLRNRLAMANTPKKRRQRGNVLKRAEANGLRNADVNYGRMIKETHGRAT